MWNVGHDVKTHLSVVDIGCESVLELEVAWEKKFVRVRTTDATSLISNWIEFIESKFKIAIEIKLFVMINSTMYF